MIYKVGLVALCFLPCAATPILDSLKFFLIVRSAQTVVLERLGKYHKTLSPGLHFKAPVIDTPRSVEWSYDDATSNKRKWLSFNRLDLRETVYNFPPQSVITQDNVKMDISALVYYKIVDPLKAVYSIEDLPLAIESITQTTLRNVIGTMHLQQTLNSRDQINASLGKILDETGKQWGTHVTRVELQEITPPKDISDSMARQMKAERDSRALVLESEGKRRAAILLAEGEKDAAIHKAEGEKLAAILKAEGAAMATIKKAEAEKEFIEKIQQACGFDQATSYILSEKYLSEFSNLGNKGNLIVVPYDGASLASVTSVIGKILKNKDNL